MESQFDPDSRFDIVKSIGEECVQEDELRRLLETKAHPVCYDGFEPSGRMHIAQGILKAINVNKLTSQGCKFVFWVADWFALMNNKCDGDLERIRANGRRFIEIWQRCGMDLANVEFKWASEEINAHPQYWEMVLDVSREFSVKRLTRCSQIMGRAESDSLTGAQIFYPCMQCADIFFLKADICQLGLDQRKVNMLAREYAALKHLPAPVILSHHMLMGLKKGQIKMSKRDENSAIFMDDSEQAVIDKVNSAYCPPANPTLPNLVAENPLFDWLEHLIFPKWGSFDASNRSFDTYKKVVDAYASTELSAVDLKAGIARSINRMLIPIRI
jgi:tyrosyl-tRNA synthetase